MIPYCECISFGRNLGHGLGGVGWGMRYLPNYFSACVCVCVWCGVVLLPHLQPSMMFRLVKGKGGVNAYHGICALAFALFGMAVCMIKGGAIPTRYRHCLSSASCIFLPSIIEGLGWCELVTQMAGQASWRVGSEKHRACKRLRFSWL